MTTEEFHRKLTAILNADVQGYSRLMEEDEDNTVRTLTAYRALMTSLIQSHRGHVVDTPGDNLLAEFGSVMDAVRCAVEIQEELRIRNAELPEDRRMQFRIGINLGDIIEEGDHIYGDGVNIAARVEGLAEGGGICISGTVYDAIRNKLSMSYEFMGEHVVKNIKELVRIYKIKVEPEAESEIKKEKKAGLRTWQWAAIAGMAIIILGAVAILYFYFRQAPEATDVEKAKKSIAVLPFTDLSPEKDQEYFVDGLSEEILNSLTQIPDLTVIARTSSFSFKGTNKKVQEIASELGVENILEGSVRKAGNALRITAQLVKAVDGSHLWSKTYDRELKDIFVVQEDIATAVAGELKATLGIGQSIKQLGGTDNTEAYELYLIAQGKFIADIYHSYKQALELIDAAIGLDPKFALAWALKASIHTRISVNSSADLVTSNQEAALNAIQKAIEIEPNLANRYYTISAEVKMLKGDFTGAESDYRKTLELTSESGSFIGGILHSSVGHIKKANELFGQARRNNPLDQGVRGHYVLSFGFLENMPQAEEEYERGKVLFGDKWSWGGSAITWLRLGAGDVVTPDKIICSDDPKCDAIKEHIHSPKEALVELHRIYSDFKNPSNADLADMSVYAAYCGDPEFAMEAMDKACKIDYSRIAFIWLPLMREVRQLSRFKEFVREIGLVDYWNKFGWPDICHQLENSDFVCD